MEATTTESNINRNESGADRRFKIPGDTVNKATADLDDRHRSAVRWLHAHASEQDLSLEEVGKLVRYDGSTMHRLFHGKYEGSLDNVCKEIEQFRALHEERARGRKLPFIETNLAKKIWKYCDACLEFQRIGFIIGDSQIGKTTALAKYQQDHNHGQTIYVRMPAGGVRGIFLVTLATALRINPRAPEKDMIRRIMECFDDRMLLVIDEVHQTVIRENSMLGVRTIELIREIYDNTGCGVVLCGTHVFDREMEVGRFQQVFLQLKRRRLAKLTLPASPSVADLNTFSRAYGLAPAEGDALKLQTEMIREEALGMWLCLLRMGAKIASKRGKPMAWGHVLAAHEGLKSLEGN
jgi:DNA transposition AAA+ family ATPase